MHRNTPHFFLLCLTLCGAAWIDFESIGKLDSIVIWKTHAFIIDAIEAWIYCSFFTQIFFRGVSASVRWCVCVFWLHSMWPVCTLHCVHVAAAATEVITVHLHAHSVIQKTLYFTRTNGPYISVQCSFCYAIQAAQHTQCQKCRLMVESKSNAVQSYMQIWS